MPIHILSTGIGNIVPSQYYLPLAVGLIGATFLRAWASGPSNTRERDLHGRTIIVTVSSTSSVHDDRQMKNLSLLGSFHSGWTFHHQPSCSKRRAGHRFNLLIVRPSPPLPRACHSSDSLQRTCICRGM